MTGTTCKHLIWIAFASGLAACGGAGSSSGNEPPTVTVTSPTRSIEIGASEPDIVSISYVDNDPDDVARTDLLADQDGDLETTADQVLIASARPEQDGATQVVEWDVDGVAPGTYTIFARTRDGGSSTAAIGSGQVLLNAPSTLVIVDPAEDTIVSRGGFLAVDYIDNDPDDVAITWIHLDADGDPSTHTPGDSSSAPRFEMDGARQSVRFQPSQGRYALLGTTWDGTNIPADATGPSVRVENVAFARAAGSAASDTATDVASFPDGSTVVTGWVNDGAVFGASEPGETTLSTGGDQDAFIARYNPDGTLAFVRGFGGSPFLDTGNGVAVIPDGSFFVTGTFRGTATLGAGEANETTLTSTNDAMFLARFDGDGTLVHAIQNSGIARVQGYGIAAYDDGSCLVTGTISGTTTFGLGEANETTVTTSGTEMYVARFHPDGSLDWLKTFASSSSLGRRVEVLPGGDFLLLGTIANDTTFGPGEPNETTLTPDGSDNHVIARFAADGTLVFVKRVGANATAVVPGLRVAVFPDETYLVAGWFLGTARFGEGEPNETTRTAANQDGYIAHYEADGSLRHVHFVADTSIERAYDVATLPDGSYVVTGIFGFTLTLGAGEENETTLSPGSSGNSFVARYHHDGRLIYARAIDGSSGSGSQALVTSRDGSFSVVGGFSGTKTFAPQTPNEITLDSTGNADVFVARYNADGDF